MRASDIPAALRLTRASHWNQLARDWELFLALSPDGCRVAVADDGEVVGSVATVRYGTAFGWIAMVLVDPAARGQGIGSHLLQAALEILDDMSTVRLDATPAGHRVYSRFEFFDEYTIHRMQRVAQPLAGDAAAVQQVLRALDQGPPVRLMEITDLPQVFAHDLEVFGASRRTLLDVFRDQAPEYAWVCGAGQVDGYLFGRRGHSFQHLGPLVARDDATARRLLGACLAANADRPFIVDVPVRPWMTEFLESLQFTLQRPFTRMYRGQPCRQERTDRLFAIAGPEFA
jgi:GNAT superfamily N-acetyltransferase